METNLHFALKIITYGTRLYEISCGDFYSALTTHLQVLHRRSDKVLHLILLQGAATMASSSLIRFMFPLMLLLHLNLVPLMLLERSLPIPVISQFVKFEQ